MISKVDCAFKLTLRGEIICSKFNLDSGYIEDTKYPDMQRIMTPKCEQVVSLSLYAAGNYEDGISADKDAMIWMFSLFPKALVVIDYCRIGFFVISDEYILQYILATNEIRISQNVVSPVYSVPVRNIGVLKAPVLTLEYMQKWMSVAGCFIDDKFKVFSRYGELDVEENFTDWAVSSKLYDEAFTDRKDIYGVCSVGNKGRFIIINENKLRLE